MSVHELPPGAFLGIEAFVVMSWVWGLRSAPSWRDPVSWRLVGLAVALLSIADWFHFHGDHEFEKGLDIVASWLVIWLLLGRGRGLGKKLWGRIQSTALTRVNAASFQRECQESA